MSRERGRSALERLIPDLAPPDGAPAFVSTFLRGLGIGALVGAAIAGSALLARRRSEAVDGAEGPGSEAPAGQADED